jgi:hypothetical protein
MKKPTDEGLTKLADAAFEQAAQKVLARAVASGTPVIVCVQDEVKAVKPKAIRSRGKRALHGRRKGRNGDRMNIMNESKRYAAVGRCIYCRSDSKDADLSDEHIIPLGLDGKLILPRSSCSMCRDITSATELVVLRGLLGESRAQLGIRSKRSKKRNRKTQETFMVGIIENGKRVYREVHFSKLPTLMVMYVFEPPGILRGASPSETKVSFRLVFRSISPGASERAINLGGNVERATPADFSAFCKMLAKIAHAYAVAEYGAESFVPFLTDMIRLDSAIDPFYSYYIGGLSDNSFTVSDGGALHKMDHSIVSHEGTDYLSVRIQLFAQLEMPVYQVIVGKLIKGKETQKPS